jgi:hypothetical protein
MDSTCSMAMGWAREREVLAARARMRVENCILMGGGGWVRNRWEGGR